MVRRLLENGANSSFVHQLVNPEIAPETIAQDPINVVLERLEQGLSCRSHAIVQPQDLFAQNLASHRKNAKGWDITDAPTIALMQSAREHLNQSYWHAQPLVAHFEGTLEAPHWVINPAVGGERVGQVQDLSLWSSRFKESTFNPIGDGVQDAAQGGGNMSVEDT